MTPTNDTIQEIFQLSSRVVHGLHGPDPSSCFPLLSPQFTWVNGPLSAKWADFSPKENIFHNKSKDELPRQPVLIDDEKYVLLLSEDTTWVIFGDYTTSEAAKPPGGQAPLPVHVHATFIWHSEGGQLLLLHIHSSHTPSLYPPPLKNPLFSKSHLAFRDACGAWHRFYPEELRYVQASNQWCKLFMQSESFYTRSGISQVEKKLPGFLRVHRSYLVNPQEIASISRRRLILKSRETLPVSRDRYAGIRQELGL